MQSIAKGGIEWKRAIDREAVTRVDHAWVRVTTRCNNRCVFCLDANAQRVTSVSDDSVIEEIRRGRERGASKLILSGGEASIHPKFLDFVRLGASLGYSKIQVITNGRMFAYPHFLQHALSAGLTEMTVSIHGHDAALHDRLVAAPGAFEQAVSAIRRALPELIVNIDVCLNRENVQHLPALLDRFIALGVREFDLLHLIPFGRAFERYDSLSYDIATAMPAIRRALEISRRSDVQIWLNRFPPQYLEGFEHLIQDPWKIHDEVRGREAELRQALETGEPLHCESQARCRNCYMAGYCAALKRVQTWLKSGAAMLRVEPASAVSGSLTQFVGAGYWIRARDANAVHGIIRELRAGKLWLELESYATTDLRELIGHCRGHLIERVFVATPEDLDAVLAAAVNFEVVAILTPAIATRLASVPEPPWSRVTLMQPAPLSLTDSTVPVERLRSLFRGLPTVSVQGLPRCIALRTPRDPAAVVDSRSLSPSGALDPLRFVRQYIADFAYVRSQRCANCSEYMECRGVHLNSARANGFGALVPLPESSTCQDPPPVS
jgi:organic radical activating enzyme